MSRVLKLVVLGTLISVGLSSFGHIFVDSHGFDLVHFPVFVVSFKVHLVETFVEFSISVIRILNCSIRSCSSIFVLVADSSTGADVEAEGNDHTDDHDYGSDPGRPLELRLDGLEAAFFRGTFSDVTEPPPHGRFAEALAFKFSLDGLEELLNLFLSLSRGAAFSFSGLELSCSGCFSGLCFSLIGPGGASRFFWFDIVFIISSVLGNASGLLFLGCLSFFELDHAFVEVFNLSIEFPCIKASFFLLSTIL